jgi:hypothetical protein
MQQLPQTKAVQLGLGLFVILVILIDASAFSQFSYSESADLLASQDAAAKSAHIPASVSTTTAVNQGKSNGLVKLFQRVFGTTPPPVVPSPPIVHQPETPVLPANAPDDEILPPDVLPEDVLPPEDLPPEDVLPPEDLPPEDIAPAEDVQPFPFDTPQDIAPIDVPYDTAGTQTANGTKRTSSKPATTIRATGKLPDLYIREITVLTNNSLDKIPPNQQLGLSILVANSGSREASAFTNSIYIDEKGDGFWDRQVPIVPQGVLPANNTQRLIVAAAIKQTVSGVTVVEVCADTANVVTELNEKNNCRSIQFTVAADTPVVEAKSSVLYSALKAVTGFLNGFVQQ